ncbi:hypothetical protein [Nocardioides sp. TF02-7]|uniref:hypothetical protein n=1 Tax=Nocardioides sp. TF02-7 TaxID=2917724 RepID=UPI001F05D956|nr:hypothetical protein [Nocardioides sp. TF02-7]UMG92428.1 hypothetical protein MF408_21630 [Nocardioides sp. TF02-7]
MVLKASLAVALLLALVAIGVLVVIGSSTKAHLEDERDEARAEAAALQGDLDHAKEDTEALNRDNADLQRENGDNKKSLHACRTAVDVMVALNKAALALSDGTFGFLEADEHMDRAERIALRAGFNSSGHAARVCGRSAADAPA